MAKRRDSEGKKVKHKSEDYEYSEDLSIRRGRNRIVTLAVVSIVVVIALAIIFLFVLAPEEEVDEKEILTAESTENGGNPSNEIEFSATIYNPDKKADEFSTLIDGLPQGWTVSMPQTVTVEGKESETFTFTVTPFVDTALNKTYDFVLTMTSGNTQQSYSLDYRITVFHGTFGVKLLAYNNSHDAEAGRSVYYSLLLENTGNGEDNMTLSYTQSHLPANWTVTFEFDNIKIPGFDKRVVICTIDTFNGTENGRYDIKVRATAGNGFFSEYWLNTSLIKDFDNETVEEGDKVQVNYIGMFPEGDIFDTSLFEVFNNSKLPKDPGLVQRGSYEPLKFHVGSEQQAQGAEYGNVILGFWEGVIGMKVYETKVVRIPTEKAYTNPSDRLYGKVLMFEITLVSI
jgi:uncharacterized membrane protein